ncbi:unnamed protein product, partial [Dovyalis caffra]
MEGLGLGPGESSNNVAETVLETLRTRGWSLGDIDQLNALIFIHSALSDDGDPCTVANSLESELLNMDLRSIGAKSLPDPNLLNKTPYLHGPKILQITAIEYSHIPSIPNDIVPGSKVRLENKAPVHSCIVCLNPKVITVLGGIVQSLYDEWEMNRKYSGVSRLSLRLSQETDTGGPPLFEKLKAGAPSRRSPQLGRLSETNMFSAVSDFDNVLVFWFCNMPHLVFESGDRNLHKHNGQVVASVSSASMGLSLESRFSAHTKDYFESTSRQVTTESSGNTEVIPLDAQRKADSIDYKVKIASLKASHKENPRNSQWRSKEDYHGSTSKSNMPTVAQTSGNTELRPMDTRQKVDDDKERIVSFNESLEQKPSDTTARQKGVFESAPVQNQAAAQKLLLKMNHHPNEGDQHLKGRKYRGKSKQEESQVFTLGEWEKRNAGPQPLTKKELPATSHDEDLAWRLQNQLDVEDFHNMMEEEEEEGGEGEEGERGGEGEREGEGEDLVKLVEPYY